MSYFTFKNGETPLNDTNLNLMQDKIKEAINDTGSWQDLELINGWENLDTSTFHNAQIKRDRNRIYLRGVLKVDNKTDNIIAYIPESYRPSKTKILSAMTSVPKTAQESRRLSVYPDGRLLVSFEDGLTETTGYFSLDGVSFDID